MFDFEKLDVYARAKDFNAHNRRIIATNKLDFTTTDQLRRASFSVVLNIAESASRFSRADRRNMLVFSRGSIFECVAILDILHSEMVISTEVFDALYRQAEVLSKMLFTMIRQLEK